MCAAVCLLDYSLSVTAAECWYQPRVPLVTGCQTVLGVLPIVGSAVVRAENNVHLFLDVET